jgi:hypothetical protein
LFGVLRPADLGLSSVRLGQFPDYPDRPAAIVAAELQGAHSACFGRDRVPFEARDLRDPLSLAFAILMLISVSISNPSPYYIVWSLIRSTSKGSRSKTSRQDIEAITPEGVIRTARMAVTGTVEDVDDFVQPEMSGSPKSPDVGAFRLRR